MIRALLALSLLVTGCEWIDASAIPCTGRQGCFDGYECVGETADAWGTCAPIGSGDDDDSATPDDDDTAAPDDDDSAAADPLGAVSIQVRFAFEVGPSGADGQPVELGVTAHYFEDDALSIEICRRRITATGTVHFGPSIAPGCPSCSGRMTFDPSDVTDPMESDPQPGDCLRGQVDDEIDLAGSLLGQHIGPGRDLLDFALLDREEWEVTNAEMSNGYFNSTELQSRIDGFGPDLTLTHAMLVDMSRSGLIYSRFVPDLGIAFEGTWYGVGWTWVDAQANPSPPSLPFMLGTYSGRSWWIHSFDAL